MRAMLRRLKNDAIWLLVRGAVAVVARVPAAWHGWLGDRLAALALRLAPGERRRAAGQLAAAFGHAVDGPVVRTLLRGTFRELARNALALAGLNGRSRPELPGLTDPARRILDAARATGRGAVFFTGHLGNWELLAITLAQHGYPVTVVGRPSYDPRFTALVDGLRGRFGVEVVARGEPGSAARLLRALRAGRFLGVLIDQDTSLPGVFVPFFGRLAHTPVGPAELARRTGAVPLAGWLRRRRDGGATIVVERLEDCADAAALTARATRRLEAWIRERPSQWVWLHDRWRTRPATEVAS